MTQTQSWVRRFVSGARKERKEVRLSSRAVPVVSILTRPILDFGLVGTQDGLRPPIMTDPLCL